MKIGLKDDYSESGYLAGIIIGMGFSYLIEPNFLSVAIVGLCGASFIFVLKCQPFEIKK